MSDPAAGYRSIRTGAALVPAGREVLWVGGSDAVAFLDGLVSRSVASLPPGTAGRALLLSPKGRLRASLWLLGGDNGIGIVVDAGVGPVVAADLGRFRIRVDATIEADSRVGFDVWGPTSGDVVRRVTGTVPEQAAGWTGTADGGLVARTPFLRVGLPRFLVLGVAAEEFLAAGAVPATGEASEAVRIEAGEPAGGDLAGEPIPQEAGVVEGAVDFDKGCFLGQELVARIDSRGHVNRRLAGLIGEDGRSLEGGSVSCDGREVGNVTSAAYSPRLGAAVALAMVRAEVAIGAAVVVATPSGASSAVVSALPIDPTL